MKLIIEIEVQSYGDEDEEAESLRAIRDAVLAVVALAELSVGTFVKSDIGEEA